MGTPTETLFVCCLLLLGLRLWNASTARDGTWEPPQKPLRRVSNVGVLQGRSEEEDTTRILGRCACKRVPAYQLTHTKSLAYPSENCFPNPGTILSVWLRSSNNLDALGLSFRPDRFPPRPRHVTCDPMTSRRGPSSAPARAPIWRRRDVASMVLYGSPRRRYELGLNPD